MKQSEEHKENRIKKYEHKKACREKNKDWVDDLNGCMHAWNDDGCSQHQERIRACARDSR